MEVLTYVPSNVVVLICGWQVEGWNEITITRNSPTMKQIRGIRGKNTRTHILDTSATITLSIPQTEYSNNTLSTMAFLDAKNGTARLELFILDSTSTSEFTTSTAYITGFPEVRYNGELTERVWTIQCEDSLMNVGYAKPAAAGIVEGGISKLKSFVNNIL